MKYDNEGNRNVLCIDTPGSGEKRVDDQRIQPTLGADWRSLDINDPVRVRVIEEAARRARKYGGRLIVAKSCPQDCPSDGACRLLDCLERS